MPAPGAFVLGRSKVGDPLGSSPAEWVDILDHATRVRAVRGGSTPRLNQLDVGTLTVDLVDVDPEGDARLRFGRQIRLIDEHAGSDKALHWIGRVQDVTSREVKPSPRFPDGRTVTMLHAVDVVGRTAGTKLVGAGDQDAETLGQRVHSLNARVDVDVVFSGPDTAGVLAATGVDVDLAEHLNMACDSLRAAWRPTLEDTIEVRTWWPADAELAFLDRDAGTHPGRYTIPSARLYPGDAP